MAHKGDVQYFTSSTVDQAYVGPRRAFTDKLQVRRGLTKANVVHVALKRDKTIPHHVIRTVRGATGVNFEFHADVIVVENLTVRASQYHTCGRIATGRVGALATWWQNRRKSLVREQAAIDKCGISSQIFQVCTYGTSCGPAWGIVTPYTKGEEIDVINISVV